MHVSHDEVKRLFGDITDHKIVEIIDSGATIRFSFGSLKAILAAKETALSD